MFDLNQLRCFVTVAEELHFGRAAARLNMTQPPLSRQIQVLEHIIDAPLLERTSRSVRLTPAGRSFLPEARRILKLAESASQVARRIALGKTGSLKIGLHGGRRLWLPARVDRGLPRAAAGGRFLAEGNGLGRPDRGARPPARSMPACCGRRSRGPSSRPGACWPSRCSPRSRRSIRWRRATTIAIKDFDGQPFVMYSPYELPLFPRSPGGAVHARRHAAALRPASRPDPLHPRDGARRARRLPSCRPRPQTSRSPT